MLRRFQSLGWRAAESVFVDEVNPQILPVDKRDVRLRVGHAQWLPASLEVFVHILSESSVATSRLQASTG